MKTYTSVLIALTLLGSPAAAHAQAAAYTASQEDIAAVERASLAYLDAIYKTDPSLIERYVHPSLTKVGYYRNRQGVWNESPMTYAQLLNVARTWNAGGKTLRPDAPRQAVIHEVLNRTASAKVVAQWGIDYLQLVKYDDGWKIRHILWQEPPPRSDKP
jgi:hypothetical protein